MLQSKAVILSWCKCVQIVQAFSALYEKMLSVQDEHLRTTQNKLEGFVDEVLAELTAEKKDKR